MLPIAQLAKNRFDNREKVTRVRVPMAVVVAIVVIGNVLQMTGALSVAGRFGTGLLLLALMFVMYRYGKVRGAGALPGDLGPQQSAAFYRAQLVRHRDALRTFRWEYALPFTPGLIIVIGERAANPPSSPAQYAVLALLFAALIAAIGWFNSRAARKIQAEIDEIDRLSRSH
ncbi:MAG: hypothetical protein HY657_11315 [Acidobacteria bacterium]|nr:hypothetical protein [Acidobacteriota bacterium]